MEIHTNLIYDFNDPQNNENIFNKYYQNDSKTEFFRKSVEQSILKEIEPGKWTFIHKSIMEYLISL